MNKALEKEFRALGTDIYVQIVPGESGFEKAKKDLGEISRLYREQEKIFSRFDKASELSFLNNNLGKFQKASKDLIQVARRCLEYYQLSQGIFDPRIVDFLEKIGYQKSFREVEFSQVESKNQLTPTKGNLGEYLEIKKDQILFNCRMDFSGVAKGYITDKVAAWLLEKGHENFLVDSGGDIYACGKNSEGEIWRISLESPGKKEVAFGLSDSGVATSGISRKRWRIGNKRFHHLINPKNPNKFSFDLCSVTVLEKTAEKADFWAKVLFLRGLTEGLRLAREKKIKSLFLDYRGNIYVTNIKV